MPLCQTVEYIASSCKFLQLCLVLSVYQSISIFQFISPSHLPSLVAWPTMCQRLSQPLNAGFGWKCWRPLELGVPHRAVHCAMAQGRGSLFALYALPPSVTQSVLQFGTMAQTQVPLTGRGLWEVGLCAAALGAVAFRGPWKRASRLTGKNGLKPAPQQSTAAVQATASDRVGCVGLGAHVGQLRMLLMWPKGTFLI